MKAYELKYGKDRYIYTCKIGNKDFKKVIHTLGVYQTVNVKGIKITRLV
jgi:hypothetical protein